MKSRMEKYNRDENILQRTTKNDPLYEELYREKKEPTSNVTVLDNVNEIDITKIKEMVDNREQYRKVRNYENLMNINSSSDNNLKEYDFDEIDDGSYDINEILERKREDRFSLDDSRVRNISNIKIQDIDRKTDEDLDFTIHDEKIKTLINTIVSNDQESDDLFANLRENEEDKKEEQTFYTNTDAFDNKDFEVEEDIEENNKGGSKSLVIISIIALVIAIGIFIWYKFFS